MLTPFLVLVPLVAPQAEGGEPVPAYRLEILPSHLPTQPANPGGLSDRGEAVGFGIESLWFQAVHWPDPATAVDLKAEFGLVSSSASGIDSAGNIVGGGTYSPTTEKDQAFLIPAGGTPQFLPKLAQGSLIGSHAIDVTDSGLIAGWCDTAPSVFFGNAHAVLWENGVVVDLGTLPDGDTSNAAAVNESKLVVGVATLPPSFPPPTIRGFAWTEATGMVQLPGLDPLARTVAADVNESGLIVGDADLDTGRFPAIWPSLSTIQVLPMLPVDEYGGCAAVNDFGQIVGYGRVAAGFRGRLWQGGQPHDLDALTDAGGLTVDNPVAINRRGQVLSYVWDFQTVPAVPMVGLLTPDLLWDDLGAALAGTNGEPRLAGFGNMLPLGPLLFEVEDALANSLGFAVFGIAAANVPFFGGTLVPSLAPPGFWLGLATDGAGRAEVSFLWPPGLPPGLQLFSQVWILDGGAVQGLAATNALRATAP